MFRGMKRNEGLRKGHRNKGVRRTDVYSGKYMWVKNRREERQKTREVKEI